jgi:hypothetical protein
MKLFFLRIDLLELLCPGGQVRVGLLRQGRRLIRVEYFQAFLKVKIFVLVVIQINFSFVCSANKFFACMHDMSTAGMTTGTPIAVLVPNTDQRGHVSIQV